MKHYICQFATSGYWKWKNARRQEEGSLEKNERKCLAYLLTQCNEKKIKWAYQWDQEQKYIDF